MTLPIPAKIDSSASTICIDQLKLLKNQIKIVANNTIVPAFLRRLKPRSYIVLKTPLTFGRWYAGNSMIKGDGSLANNLVFFNIMPETMIAAIPTKYADGATHTDSGNSAPENQCNYR